MKLFTLEEAQSMLPVVESLLKHALDNKKSAQDIEDELGSLSRRIYLSGGMHIDIAKIAARRAEMEQFVLRARESVAEIDEIGVQVKDLDSGLLDFPCRMEDDVVLLCWKRGEALIEHWHTMDAGFQGRQPIDDRFRRRSTSSGPNNRPN